MPNAKKSIKRIKTKVLQDNYQYDNKITKIVNESEIYSVATRPASQLTYQFMAKLVKEIATTYNNKPTNELRVLDWGGGKGHVSYFLQNQGFKNISLLEIEGYPHREIWKAIDIEVNYFDKTSNKLPYESGEFDVIVGAGVLEHVAHDESALKELQRILAPDGMLFIFNLPSSTGIIHRISNLMGDNYHDRLYSKREIKMLLKRSGLRPLAMYKRQLLPRKRFHYNNPELIDKIDNYLCSVPFISYFSASIEIIAVNQNCHKQEG